MKSERNMDKKNREIELKLQIASENIDQLLRHPLLENGAASKRHQEELTSTYYDTPDFSLKSHGASLRLRQTENGWVQTFKAGGKVDAGLHQRNEWEVPVSGPSLAIDTLREMIGSRSQWSGFFQSLYAPKRVNVYIDSLSALQDELGHLNDAAVADGLLQELCKNRLELAHGIGFARGYLMANSTHQTRRIRKLWNRFEPMKPPSLK